MRLFLKSNSVMETDNKITAKTLELVNEKNLVLG